MTTWFTSDQHFGHKNIIEFCDRPFKDTDHMDEAMIENYNALVKPDDVVYHLGDLVMGDFQKGIAKTARLNGIKKLIPGNHDKVFYLNKESQIEKYRPYYEDAGFEILEPQVKLYGSTFEMCHFPYEGDHGDKDRYADQRPKDEGRWLIHGHIHEKWQMRGRMLNVGVDVWDFKPVRLSTVTAMFTPAA